MFFLDKWRKRFHWKHRANQHIEMGGGGGLGPGAIIQQILQAGCRIAFVNVETMGEKRAQKAESNDLLRHSKK